MNRAEINRQIDEIAAFLGVQPIDERYEIKLSAFKEVDKALITEVYIAFTTDKVIYVGQGKVRKRLKRLTEKLTGGDFTKMRAKDTEAFDSLRANHSISTTFYTSINFHYDSLFGHF